MRKNNRGAGGSSVRSRALCSLAAGVALSTVGTRAHAQGAEKAFGGAMRDAAAAAIPLLLLPSNIGPELRFAPNRSRDTRFILGWPLQIPLPFDRHAPFVHRLALAPEIAIGADDSAVFRGRVGYRLGWRWLVAGAGIGADKTAFFVSPELGLRLPPADPEDFSLGGLLDLRFDYEPDVGGYRVSAMLGWVVL